MAIIGISGKKQHGKDTVANIIQCLTAGYSDEDIINVLTKKAEVPDYHLLPFSDETTWEKKQFAYKLKKIVCELIGCTMKQLEDNKFKEATLGEEWRRYYFTRANVRYFTKGFNGYTWENDYKYFSSLEEAEQKLKEVISQLQDHSPDWWEVRSEVLTPRLLLQLIGTDGGRDIVHPQIWVNATMADYNPKYNSRPEDRMDKLDYPNWIITDVRFPNEAEAIKKRGGIIIRVNRPGMPEGDNHPS